MDNKELQKIKDQLDNGQGLTCMQGRQLYEEMIRQMNSISNMMQNAYPGAYPHQGQYQHAANNVWYDRGWQHHASQSPLAGLGQQMFWPFGW